MADRERKSRTLLFLALGSSAPDTAGQCVLNFVHQNRPERFEKITLTELVSLEVESRNQHFQNKFPQVILGSRFKHESHSGYRKEGEMRETERYPQISTVDNTGGSDQGYELIAGFTQQPKPSPSHQMLLECHPSSQPPLEIFTFSLL